MAYCAPLGIPHSEFKRWDPLDQAKALAWRQREAEKCPGGHHPDLAGDDDSGLTLGSELCPMCEIAESQQPEFEKNRLAGQYRVWKHLPPDEDPPALT